MECHRIPGIVVTPRGTVLAFAEARPRFGDADPKSIVLKRSGDGGHTWSDVTVIEQSDGSFWARHSAQLDPRDAAGKREVWTNPAPLINVRTGQVFIFYALNEGIVGGTVLQRYTRVFYRVSKDEGRTWSDRIEVTDILKARRDGSPNRDERGNWVINEDGFPCDYLDRSFHMPGPGHGLQLANGRLLLQFWNRRGLRKMGAREITPIAELKYGICTIFSDDNGRTWKYGAAFGHDLSMNESRMAELADGTLYLNARYASEPRGSRNHRAVAYSRDGGLTWEREAIDRSFPTVNTTDAGLVFDPVRGVLLYSKNESLTAKNRSNLVLRASRDQGAMWSVVATVDEGPASYSDLALLGPDTALLLYETTTLKGSRVDCVRMDLRQLIPTKR